MLAFRNPPETWRVFSYILMGNHGKSLNNAGFSIAHLWLPEAKGNIHRKSMISSLSKSGKDKNCFETQKKNVEFRGTHMARSSYQYHSISILFLWIIVSLISSHILPVNGQTIILPETPVWPGNSLIQLHHTGPDFRVGWNPPCFCPRHTSPSAHTSFPSLSFPKQVQGAQKRRIGEAKWPTGLVSCQQMGQDMFFLGNRSISVQKSWAKHGETCDGCLRIDACSVLFQGVHQKDQKGSPGLSLGIQKWSQSDSN